MAVYHVMPLMLLDVPICVLELKGVMHRCALLCFSGYVGILASVVNRVKDNFGNLREPLDLNPPCALCVFFKIFAGKGNYKI